MKAYSLWLCSLIAGMCTIDAAAHPTESLQPKVTVHSDTPPKEPLGLPAVPWPKDNPYSKKKAELGRLLFFDTRLSSNETISCASCHAPHAGFADDKPVSLGINGNKGTRNAQTVINCCYQTHCFWDGRANSLEEQVIGPLANPKEMTTAKSAHEAYKHCEECIGKIQGYAPLFKEAFGDDSCSLEHISKAIATFERTILSGNSPYDRYVAGDRTAMTSQQIEGLRVFKKVGCANCHGGSNFTDGRFMNIGIGMADKNPDLGRYDVTKDSLDIGAFKTPTLRDVSKSAPYMHDGSLKTLEEVVDYYDKGGTPNPHLSFMMKPLKMTSEDKKALVAFMYALDGEGWELIEAPKTFPK